MSDAKRVYCAGPLFNDKEREEMAEIAAALEAAGFTTFLPQRDGLEFSPLMPMLMMAGGLTADQASIVWDKAIFALDAYQASVAADAVVINLNGRVPDEGAVAEAAMAWARGKVVVGYKSDARSLVMGRDNAMVVGLLDFRVAPGMKGVLMQLRDRLAAAPTAAEIPLSAPLALGCRITEAMAGPDGLDGVARLMLGDAAD